MKKFLTLAFLAFAILSAHAQANSTHILSMKDRAETIDRLLEDKIQNYLPGIMRREGVDMWVVMSREYNEDPVIKTLLPATWLAARRRTILIMFDRGEKEGIESIAVARYDVGPSFKSAWNPEEQPDQWARVAEIIRERNPKKIAVNKSKYFGITDGVVATDLEEFTAALNKKDQAKIISAEKVAIGWLETRTEAEMAIYPHIVRISHMIIQEAFSDKVITPGVTTTEDVVWWMRDKVVELGLQTWFHPTVDVQRADPESFDHLRTFTKRPEKNVILPGDLLHCDFGITYLRLNTDQQQHAYVLRPSETEVPSFLQAAFKNGNRLQDIFTNNFEEGRTGNEVLKMSREQAIAEGIKPSIYTHPIGYHGHASGTTLGMWDSQGGVPVTGDYPLHLNTAYSIELNAATYIQEWKKEIRIMLEEEAFFDKSGVWYIDGRQNEIMTIPRLPARSK
ncbi:metallopeptidase family M24 [Roseivirga ehrenbergii]|uniref:Xaa-Pro aminopeptidase n=1 Tax=Roseivirga ehrenbergii (strain DSM 102268 / JCM 13514 / KCTC 12282 / NCIMB 14502 / KMM 6017) TaxID=279360 RepID=A0A150X7S7_ROSEK|nr:M24 family metallopeptidase [Roseivirga ehrenbergii]KYG74778.1 Xaa-Pro aminopeptidase [Roseivirga ehrenbergii]TCL13891.1 metallopeptidase family M24 [Roseivirga ehrenbergii]